MDSRNARAGSNVADNRDLRDAVPSAVLKQGRPYTRTSIKVCGSATSGFFDEFREHRSKKAERPKETLGLTVPGGGKLSDLTFDKAGNLWIPFVADREVELGS